MISRICKKLPLLALPALACFLFSSPAIATYTFEYHPGAMCQHRVGSSATRFDRANGRIQNNSNANDTVYCPFKVKWFEFDDDNYYLNVSVWDRHTSYGVSCRQYVADFDGSSVAYGSSASTSAGYTGLTNLVPSAVTGYSYWNYYIRCDLPKINGSDMSEVTQYTFYWIL